MYEIKRVRDELRASEWLLATSELVSDAEKKEIIYESVLKNVMNAACMIRRLISGTAEREGVILREMAHEHVSVESCLDGRGVHIVMPCLLPRMRSGDLKMEKEYLAMMLAPALKDFHDRTKMWFTGKRTVVFIHCYGGRRIYDCDNLSRKVAMDVITAFLMPDDGGLEVSQYVTARRDDADHTEIFIIDRKDFPELLEMLRE